MNESEQTNDTPLMRGARAGLPFGLYLSIMSALLVLSVNNSMLCLPVIPLLLCIPIIVYRFMINMYRQTEKFRTLSSLWFAGIVLFICGAMTCGAITLLLIHAVNPDFVIDYAKMAVANFDAAGLASSADVDILRKAIELKILPTPFEFVLSMMWSTAFLGSILSLCLGLLATMMAARSRSFRQY